MVRAWSESGGHEYYGTLTGIADASQAGQTFSVRAGGVYYFSAWNDFSLVFQDADIRSYSVHILGQSEESLVEVLAQAERSIIIRLEP